MRNLTNLTNLTFFTKVSYNQLNKLYNQIIL
jgi:hypothetical protein